MCHGRPTRASGHRPARASGGRDRCGARVSSDAHRRRLPLANVARHLSMSPVARRCRLPLANVTPLAAPHVARRCSPLVARVSCLGTRCQRPLVPHAITTAARN
jgi:hypothetical protein